MRAPAAAAAAAAMSTALCALAAGCGATRPTSASARDEPRGATPAGAAPACELPGAPAVVRRVAAAILERWDIDATPALFEPVLPPDPGYAAYRAAIRQAGAELVHPIADPPAVQGDAERELWRREDRNRELAYSGDAGAIRPIHCLEALFFARQHARHDQLAAPTEFLLAVLERRDGGGRRRLRLYFAAGDQMFPPKSVYPFPDVAADVAAGWDFTVLLHNHTIRRRGDRPALGVTAPSTSDVEILRGLAAELRLRAAWVTNGVYTIEIPAVAFARYSTRTDALPTAETAPETRSYDNVATVIRTLGGGGHAPNATAFLCF